MYQWIRKDSSSTPMREITSAGVTYLAFPALLESGMVRHGFSTRMGGVSEGPYATMNFSFTRGDDPEAVRENYRRMAEALRVDMEKMVLTWQTHTTNVRVVSEEDLGKGIIKERDYRDVDGLVTDMPDVTLVTFFADCVPLYFLDKKNRAIGLSHSGWRGTVGKIGKVTVETMTREFGSDPKDILAAVGPSICQDCYEVSEEVIGLFRENFAEELWPKLFYGKENGHYQLNLWEANRLIFEEAGILPEHITVTDVCTACNPELLFSHRASGGKRGNLAGFLGLRA